MHDFFKYVSFSISVKMQAVAFLDPSVDILGWGGESNCLSSLPRSYLET